MDMSMELYFEINGIRYQIDPNSCSLIFSANKNELGKTKASLEIIAGGKSIYVDLT